MGPGDEDDAPRRAPGEDLADALDGAGGDLTVSADAMRWSPDQVATPAPPRGLPGIDVAVGIGEFLGFDAAALRRVVSGVATRLATVAGDAVAELRQLAADRLPGDDRR
ncbi:hypothetical protein SAMN04488107_2578 [Geodermatophilus saharensis]|uniref:Uncharacterized protein n=1 Tax=Geodermatophilus saharensis TaxID=1137994 RepID=A0A239EJR4_9ACTN|nr:hypothetical protein [Geodermatophilus saharensis]SNS44273.1 hypothetical protein SAMN04488107_2578 [Geodermatophilus saharensis]